MVTLQEQIRGSLLRPGPARSGLGPQLVSPRVPDVVKNILTDCTFTAVGGTLVEMCPTPYPIIKKTKFLGPPYKMEVLGNRAYEVSAFWSTGTALFFQTPDGMIIAKRSDGTGRIYRPRKHIVVSSNPRVKNLVRARNRIDQLSKRLRGAIGARSSASSRGKRR